ncbi:MAG TPA: TonB-dependent receptor, partial [Cyclobacteriaceae bacterium]|nr:TonB-dependent receptor [Cyclobacteriaceae bacterium]
TATAPGAVEQQAGVFNKTFFGGITNDMRLNSSFRFVASAFGTSTNFENPFITNYEIRNERNAGVRSYVEYSLRKNKIDLTWNTGLEGQWADQEISNYDNNAGQQGSLRAADDISIDQIFYFSRVSANIYQRLTGEIAVSLNQYKYHFSGSGTAGSSALRNEWMPRVGASYTFNEHWAIRFVLSRGYSPPSVAEIRPSGGMINNQLQAEWGWNREAGIRFSTLDNRLQVDGSVFRFDLKNAIVRRTDVEDQEYFTNAGGTKQTGVECFVLAWLIPRTQSGVIHGLRLNLSFTYNHFVFDQYADASEDYSGNWLTGVPKNVGIGGVTVYLPKKIFFSIQSNLTSRLPLNDANSVYTEKYHLLQARIQWQPVQTPKLRMDAFAGADNLLNQKYSLGNDINAFGGRYYNAAPERNFYAGIEIGLQYREKE